MSNKIDSIHFIKIDGFSIKKDALLRLLKSDDLPEEFSLNGDDNVRDEIDEIEQLDLDIIPIEIFDFYGEYSGYFWQDFVQEIPNMVGYCQFLVVWNNGDTIKVVTLDNGKREEKHVVNFIKGLMQNEQT